MLAYEPGISSGYGIFLTASSLAVAMALTSWGFGFAVTHPGRWRAPIGGGIIGAGIACMHYLGMWALEVPGRVTGHWTLCQHLSLSECSLDMLLWRSRCAIMPDGAHS